MTDDISELWNVKQILKVGKIASDSKRLCSQEVLNLLPDQRLLEKKLYKVLPTVYSKSLKAQLRKHHLQFFL